MHTCHIIWGVYRLTPNAAGARGQVEIILRIDFNRRENGKGDVINMYLDAKKEAESQLCGCEETLEAKLVALLQLRGETICFAESCTGGMCSARLVNVPDASKVMALGLVTYAEGMKVRYLGV